MILYGLTIFASAFLLFLLQPITAKQILPWFGGSAAVWTTCLVFFQTALLAGYAYSDLAVNRLPPRRQVTLHSALLVLSLALLPIIPAVHWKPTGTENPSWLILGLLGATIGLPYFLLSTTSPLVQAWFARARPGASPYRLFALSNLASMLGLLCYPMLVEPWTRTREQAIGWSVAYAAFVVVCVFAGWRSLAGDASLRQRPDAVVSATAGPPPSVGDQLTWCALAATGSVLLLAVSNHITQNIAAVPLLWIVPLAIYLLTFILAFDTTGWYRRPLVLPAVAAGLGVMGWTLADRRLVHVLELQLPVFCIGLFLACMFCHGELARLKPAPRYLTRFYLMVSVGGAVGSIVVGILAPLFLPAYFELGGGLLLCAVLLVLQVRRDAPVFRGLAVAAVLVTLGTSIWSIRQFFEDTIYASRNFYGVLRVLQVGTTGPTAHRSLVHGTILHGTQYLAPDLRRRPSTYYTASSGIGRLLESIHPTLQPLKVGVIGLGTGTLAAWGSTGDVYRFYDINPEVPRIARTDFSFLGDSDATIEIALGDARLTLERETPQGFDILAVDAFSSDAIPVHLITREALGVYLRHMKPGGVIAFHVTNRFLDLVPVVEALAHERDLGVIHVVDTGEEPLSSKSDWMLLSSDRAKLGSPLLVAATKPIQPRRDWRVWTDDFNNLLQVLR